MKIKELVEKLQAYPENMHVVLCHDDGDRQHTFKPQSSEEVMICDGMKVCWVEMTPIDV